MTTSTIVTAHALQPAPANAPKEPIGRSSEAPAFALLIDALTAGQTRGAALRDPSSMTGDAKRSGKNEDKLKPPSDAPGSGSPGAAFALVPALAAQASIPIGKQSLSPPTEAAPRQGRQVGPQISEIAPHGPASAALASGPMAANAVAAITHSGPPAGPGDLTPQIATPPNATAPLAEGNLDRHSLGIRQLQMRSFLGLDYASGAVSNSIMTASPAPGLLVCPAAATDAPPVDQPAYSPPPPGAANPTPLTVQSGPPAGSDVSASQSATPPNATAPPAVSKLDRRSLDIRQLQMQSFLNLDSASSVITSSTVTPSPAPKPPVSRAAAIDAPPVDQTALSTSAPPRRDGSNATTSSELTSQVPRGAVRGGGLSNPAPTSSQRLEQTSEASFITPNVSPGQAGPLMPRSTPLASFSSASAVAGFTPPTPSVRVQSSELNGVGRKDPRLRTTVHPVQAPLSLSRAPEASEITSRPGFAGGQKKTPPQILADAPALAPVAPNSASASALPPSLNGPVKADQLPRFIAAQASDLRQASATTPSPAAAGQHVVKELDLELAPESLGAVSLKMRLSEGRLAVVVEVANPSALKAVQAEHAAIANSLGANAQPLESLVIRQSETVHNHGDKHDAANSERAPDQDEGSRSGSASQQRQPAERREARAPPLPLAPRRRADGLVV